MNWKRLIVFFALGVAISLALASIYSTAGLYDLASYDSAITMYAALFAPDFLVATAFYFWFAVGLQRRHFLQSFMIYMSVTALAYVLQYAIFGEVLINMLAFVGLVVVSAAVILGTYLGKSYGSRRRGIHVNA